MICIPKSITNKLKTALSNGDVPISRLYEMTSQERNSLFKTYVGEDFAKVVNSEFEKAMVSEQQNALKKWVKDTFDPTRKEQINKAIKKIESVSELLNPEQSEDFMNDLVSTKLGIDITAEEAQNVSKLFDAMQSLKQEVDLTTAHGSESRMAYGFAQRELMKYTSELGLKSRELSLKEYAQKPSEIAYAAAGVLKSTTSSLDNSFFGRQGIKTLLNWKTSHIWVKNFVKSWGDIGKTIFAKAEESPEGTSLLKKVFAQQSDAVMDAIYADIYSRDNALNGKYLAARNGYGLNIGHEEAFPVSFPERLPGLGRLFKASEVAFGGGALRMRADLADAMIRTAESQGVDMLDREQASSFGKLVSAMTGRGDIGKAETLSREINLVLFSIKYLKSNFDILTAHRFDSSMTKEAKRMAAWNLARIVISMSTILGIASALGGDDEPPVVEWDPRSSVFGKIRLGGYYYDISGGMLSLVTLASRIPFGSIHDGKWGFWRKTIKGEYVKYNSEEFNSYSPIDVWTDFIGNKTSPIVKMVAGFMTLGSKDFSGQKSTPTSVIAGAITPFPIQSYLSLQDASSADSLARLILDGIGFSASDTDQTPTVQQKNGMGNIIDLSIAYARAYNIDPQKAFKGMFTGEQLESVEGNLVKLQRWYGTKFDEKGRGSEAYIDNMLKEAGIPLSQRKQYNLEHIMPLGAGGDNSSGNLQLIKNDLHNSYTVFDNNISKAVRGGKMTMQEAKALSLQLKVDKTLTVNEALSLIKK